MAGARGRGRRRGTPSDPSASCGGTNTPVSASVSVSVSAPSTATEAVWSMGAGEHVRRARRRRGCHSAAWSGPSYAPTVVLLHSNSWIVAVPPFPSPGPVPSPPLPPNATSVTSTSTDPSQPPPFYFPPYMQMYAHAVSNADAHTFSKPQSHHHCCQKEAATCTSLFIF
jgi:hypothetical protein